MGPTAHVDSAGAGGLASAVMSVLLSLLLAAATPPPDLSVLGVVVSPVPARSVAVLRSGGRTRVVGLGETAFGGRLAVVTPAAITLDYEGQTVEVRLPGQSPAP